MLELPRVSLMHHVCRGAEVRGCQVLVPHDLRQSSSADAMQRAHHAVGYRWRLGEISLLTYTWMHPGSPVTLAPSVATHGSCALTARAGHGEMRKTGWIWIERHTAHIFTHAHLTNKGVSVAL